MNPQDQNNLSGYNFNIRRISVMVLFVVGFCLVLGRAFYLQIYRGEELRQKATRQHEIRQELEPQRKPIYDRNEAILASSIEAKSIYVFPAQLQNPQQMARYLAPILHLQQKDLLQKMQAKRSFVWLKRQVSTVVANRVDQLIKTYKWTGIQSVSEYRRYYPQQNLAAAVLGFTGIDSKGLEGLEYKYQHLLQGKKLMYMAEKAGKGRVLPSPEGIPNIQNFGLVLTMDHVIQYFTENALRKGIQKAKSPQGMALVMESNTGNILAIANIPGFDPNQFSRYPVASFKNHAVSRGYEPGSTFKTLTLAIALEEGLISEEEVIFCENGRFAVADQWIQDTSPHGYLSLQEIIQKSSNICASKIGLQILPSIFFQYIQELGFGKKPNIGFPAEATGKVLSAKNWTEVDHAWISFGHGILVSPLQMVTAINTIANEGVFITPRLISHGVDHQKKVHSQIKKENEIIADFSIKPPKRVFSKRVAKLLTEYMIAVTSVGGTGTNAKIEGFDVAGKTGTSEVFDPVTKKYSKNEHIASFVGFLPANNPKLTILVVVEKPQTSAYGGVIAAPIFREIAKYTLNYLKIFPDE